ncbi:hypothetical protein UQW22_09920 [Isoptericola halotolerans]|uniref:hypothetical protein n=1 Tax=Isoptericola halotolerans TaxID=300560 RepID=UPI00388EFDA0
MPDDPTPGQGGQNDGEPTGSGGQEFKAPESQEELNRIIESRLARERAKFADYDDLKSKAERFDKAEEANLSELEKERKAREAAEQKAAQYEAKEQRTKWIDEITKDSPVPASALRGSTREELEEHHETLKPHFTKEPPKRTPVPTGKGRPDEGGSRAAAALRELRRG